MARGQGGTGGGGAAGGGRALPAAPPVEGAARAWVRESLADGLGLSARVAAAAAAAACGAGATGEVRALAGALPAVTGATLGSREALEEGVEGSFAGAVEALAAMLAPAAAAGGRLLVIEDELSPPGDPVLADHGDRVFLCGNDVYHWRPVTAALDAAALTELLGSATSGYPTNGFVVAADPAGWGPFARLVEADLDALAAAAEAVVVAAYDAEGLLWWSPGPG